MQWPTHVAGAVFAGAGAAAATGLAPVETAAIVAGSVAASTSPDIDVHTGRGKAHRWWPHSLIYAGGAMVALAVLAWVWLGAFLGGVAYDWLATRPATGDLLGALPAQSRELVVERMPTLFITGLTVGYLSHLALDAMTPARIYLGSPNNGRKIGPGTIPNGSVKEMSVRLVLAVATVVVVIGAYGVEVLLE